MYRFQTLLNENMLNVLPLKLGMSWPPVAHPCNPSYLGGRDQEDYSLKTAPGK
jgi:hypothetical protein